MAHVYAFIRFVKKNTRNKLVVISGACHADELSYLFYAQIFGFAPKADSPEIRMCKTMSKLWSNFAKTGYVHCSCMNERCSLYGTFFSIFYVFLVTLILSFATNSPSSLKRYKYNISLNKIQILLRLQRNTLWGLLIFQIVTLFLILYCNARYFSGYFDLFTFYA